MQRRVLSWLYKLITALVLVSRNAEDHFCGFKNKKTPKKLNYNTEKNKYDTALPPHIYFEKQAEEQQKKNRKITFKSIGVMISSFMVIFMMTFAWVTWPMVPQQASYYFDKLVGRQSHAQANLDAAAFDQYKDSDGDGFTDLEEIEAGYDPYDPEPSKLDSDGDGIKDDVEINYYGTDPLKADTDNDGYNDLDEILAGFSPLQPADFDAWVEARSTATIRIPKLDLEYPVVWNEDIDKIKEDLEKGVVKYKGTANPGEGNTAIVAHSSDYVWNNNKFATAFAQIDKLEAGDQIFVDYDGKRYTYVTVTQTVTDPYDTTYFAETPDESLTLGTCWPIGFSWNRLYLRADLISTEVLAQ